MRQWQLKNNSRVLMPDGSIAVFKKMDGMYAQWEKDREIFIGNFDEFRESEEEGVDYEVVMEPQSS